MVGFINSDSSINHEPTPAGQHVMVCSRVIDVGTQPGSGLYPDPKRKLWIYWELPELAPIQYEIDGHQHSRPVRHLETYTASFNEKANLRKMLESWRGIPFTPADFGGPPNGFHLKKLLGCPALGQIAHKTSDKGTFANLQTIMTLRNSAEWKNKVTEMVFFSLDEYDQAAFDSLHQNMQAKIVSSPEYQAIQGAVAHQQQHGYAPPERQPEQPQQQPQQQQPSPQQHQQHQAGGQPDFDDRIPF